jgi:hypothetical protein
MARRISLAGAMKYQLLQVNVYPFFVFAVILLVSNSCVRVLFHSDTCHFIRTGMPFVPVCPVFSRVREYWSCFTLKSYPWLLRCNFTIGLNFGIRHKSSSSSKLVHGLT